MTADGGGGGNHRGEIVVDPILYVRMNVHMRNNTHLSIRSQESQMATVACQTITTMPQPEDWPYDLWLGVVNNAIEADSCVVAVNCLHTYKLVNS